jgi:eukaryotic-like serine/threonine-protein kinase
MSPEQAMGEGRVDSRCDIFAMGSVLYRCVTGREPFDADNYLALIHKIAFDEVRAPRALVPEIPVALERVILRAMAKKVEERFSSAAEMFSALAPLVDPLAAARLPRPVGVDLDQRRPQHSRSFEGSLSSATGATSEQWQTTMEAARLGMSRRRSLVLAISGWAAAAVVLIIVAFSGQLGGSQQGASDTAAPGQQTAEPELRAASPAPAASTASQGTERAGAEASPTVEPLASPISRAVPAEGALVKSVGEPRRSSPRSSKVKGAGVDRAAADAGPARGGLRPKQWDGELVAPTSGER